MNYSTHSFNVGMATKFGLECSIILQHFHYWYQANRENPEMLKEGRVWCFSSRKNINAIFPYLSEQKIRTAIDKLLVGGYLLKGDFNTDSFNKTNWYSLTDKSLAIFGEITNPLVKSTNDWLNQPVKNNNINIQEKESKEKEPKLRYAEYVCMTEREYQKLVAEYGEPATQEFIKILNNYKGSKGKAYKNDYLAILSWVVDRYKENKSKSPAPAPVPQKPKKTKWEEMGLTEEEYNKFIKG